MPYTKILASSVNPEQLSLTIKGILVGAIPTILFVAPLLGFSLDAGELNDFVDATEKLIFWGTTGISVVMTAYGALRKILVRFGWMK